MKFLIFAFLLIFLIFPPNLYAHKTGESFEKIVGEYLVDIGYEPEVFTLGDTSTFSFELVNNESKKRIEFDDIWVRIELDKRTVFATGVSAGINFAPTMLYTFAEAGSYRLNVRYQDEGETLAETSFPITVKEEEKESTLDTRKAVLGAGGLILGGLVAVAFLKLLNGKNKEKTEKSTTKREKA